MSLNFFRPKNEFWKIDHFTIIKFSLSCVKIFFCEIPEIFFLLNHSNCQSVVPLDFWIFQFIISTSCYRILKDVDICIHFDDVRIWTLARSIFHRTLNRIVGLGTEEYKSFKFDDYEKAYAKERCTK